MLKVKILHNRRCSKSREALNILKDKGIEPEIIDYLRNPLSKSEIENLLKLLCLEPQKLIRKKEPIYKKLIIDESRLAYEEWIDIIWKNPILIERPIVIINNQKAIIARPGELVEEIL